MTFSHNCLTENEAQAQLRQRLAQHPDYPPAAGSMSRSACLVTAALVCFFAGSLPLSMTSGEGTGVWIGVTLVALSIILAGFAWNRHMLETDPAIRRYAIKAEYREASNEDLAWLHGVAKQYPAVGDAVRSWLGAGKGIRERDLRAIRAYTVEQEPIVARRELLQKLRSEVGAPDPAT